jgi:L-alanine-DL-glutamate epimerase-like enolase superfamily enzyme
MKTALIRAWLTQTALRAPVVWTDGGTETAAFHLWLELTTADGLSGLSETPVKPAWTGVDGSTAMCAVEALLAPRVLGREAATAEELLSGIRGLSFLRAAFGHALADLRAPGEAAVAPVAAVVTRGDPDAMAEHAARMVEEHGIRAVKVKAGQGLDTDHAALKRIRGAVGDVSFSVDANGAYGVDDGLELCRAAADFRAEFVEDPWPLAPDAACGAAICTAACAIAADRVVEYEPLIDGMLDRGVSWIAVKPNRLGPEAAARISRRVRERGARVVSGLFGEGPLGALQQLRGIASDAPCEALHFFEIADAVPVAGLRLEDGALSAPAGRASDLVSLEDVIDRAVASVEVCS